LSSSTIEMCPSETRVGSGGEFLEVSVNQSLVFRLADTDSA
jgi:hypothetical protein